MMSSRAAAILIVVVVALAATLMSMFTVSETELAIRMQFRAIIGANYAPGLHFKYPWDQVVKFEVARREAG